MRSVVIGDVHANRHSLSAALQVVRRHGCDQVVFIGDILTYGTDPNGCIEEILNLSQDFDVRICLGNHDQTYMELIGDCGSEYYDSLPAWIRESFDWTLSVLDVSMWKGLRFVDSVRAGATYFAHANPFEAKCWSYIKSFDDHVRAMSALSKLECSLGVFGHTHRKKVFVKYPSGAFEFLESMVLDMINLDCAVVNVGSIGQPRGIQDTFLLWIDGSETKQPRASFESFLYPKAEFKSTLSKINLSSNTKRMLMSFFE